MTRVFLNATAITQEWNRHQIKVSTESPLWKRTLSCHSCQVSNLRPFDHESGILPTELSQFTDVVLSKTPLLLNLGKERAFFLLRSRIISLSLSLSSHLSLDHKGQWGTTDDFTTSFLNISLFSTALWDLANSRPVYSLMLSSHLFFCLPCLLPPFTVPCKMDPARSDEQET